MGTSETIELSRSGAVDRLFDETHGEAHRRSVGALAGNRGMIDTPVLACQFRVADDNSRAKAKIPWRAGTGVDPH
jgi:hypothetical protein